MKIRFDFSKKNDSNDFNDKKRKYKKRAIFTLSATLVLYIIMSILFKHVAGGELWPFFNKLKNTDDKKNSSNNTKEYRASYINVIIKTSGYGGIFHTSVSLSCKKDMQIKYMIDSKKSVTKTIKANQKLVVGKGGPYDKYASRNLVISEKNKKEWYLY